MTLEGSPRRENSLADRALPVGAADRWVDLGHDDIDHAVEQFLLAGDVLVERHRDHSELLGEPAHAECLDPDLVGEGDGGAEHAVPAEADPAWSLDRLSRLVGLSR